MEQEKNDDSYVIHKVQPNYNYMVFRNERNGKVYHKIAIKQKAFDGQETSGYVQVKFKDGIDLPDRTKIKIKKAIENFYIKNFNPVFFYNIIEFENVDEAINNYADSINSADELEPPF